MVPHRDKHFPQENHTLIPLLISYTLIKPSKNYFLHGALNRFSNNAWGVIGFWGIQTLYEPSVLSSTYQKLSFHIPPMSHIDKMELLASNLFKTSTYGVFLHFLNACTGYCVVEFYYTFWTYAVVTVCGWRLSFAFPKSEISTSAMGSELCYLYLCSLK